MRNIKSIDEYNAVLENTKPLILDFYAEWCPPCKVQLPILEKIEENYSDEISVVKINIEEQREIARQFRVHSIPTIVILKDKKVIHQQAGLHSEVDLKNLLDGFKSE